MPRPTLPSLSVLALVSYLLTFQPKTPPLRGGWTPAFGKGPNGVTSTGPGEPPMSPPSTFSSRRSLMPAERRPPSLPAPPPLPMTPLLINILLLRAGIESNPGPVTDPCSVCGKRVAGGFVSFRCTSCELWCHRRCSDLNTVQEYHRLAPWSCPPCSLPQHPSHSTRESDSSDLERTLSTLTSSSSSSTSWASAASHLSLPQVPPIPTNPTARAPPAGSPVTAGRFLQFNCNGILHCHAELEDFLHKNHVLVACIQETKLRPSSSVKEFRDYASVRRDREGGAGGGLLTLVHHSVSFRDSGTVLTDDDTAETLLVTVTLEGGELHILNVYIPPATSCPAGYATNFDLLLRDRGDQLVMGDFNAHHDAWFSRTEDTRAEARGVALSEPVDASLLGVLNEDMPTRLPAHGPPSSPDVTLLSGHLLLNATWSTLTTLGSDHLPIAVNLLSHSAPPRKYRSFTNFQKANWAGFTEELERRFADVPPPRSCSEGEKVFRQLVCDASRHHIPSGYRKDYTGSLPADVRPLIAERDQRRREDPLDPQIQQLDILVQRCLRQKAQDQWQELLDSSDRTTNPRRYWSLMRKLSGKRASPPPNIDIEFGGKTHSGPKQIAKAFARQFTTSVPHRQNPAIRRLLRRIHRDHPVDHGLQFFTQPEVAAAIRGSGSSIAKGPDGPQTLGDQGLHLPHRTLQPLNCRD